jgi:DNA (cytosine-5)-methyltransferase 1
MAKTSNTSREHTPFSLVDLFCGAGGLSLGFLRAGFEPLVALDHLPAAVETYRCNLGDHVADAEISIDTELPPVTVIAGGPPCQGFSSAGMRRVGDRRNTLVSVYAQLIARYRPLAFVFENVEGFLTGEGGDRVFDLLRPLVAAGYRVHLRKVNVANYGVPQHRKRVIGIGGLGWDPEFPEPTHNAFGAPGARTLSLALPRAPRLLDTLAGLPPPADTGPGHPQGHVSPRISDADRERVAALGPGQTMRDLPQRYWHESYKRRAFRRVMDGTPTEKRGGAPAGIRRLNGDEPSKAITSFARNEFVHPIEDRFLTLRECARIQSFPDTFRFRGSTADQALLIGNAVPPTFADVLAACLKQQLAGARLGERPGKLLSFVPTSSLGMSPALQKLTERIAVEFGGNVVRGKEQLPLWA